MKIYAVNSSFYDDGRVKAYMTTLELDEKPESKYTEHPSYDHYVDYYTNKKDAEKAVAEARAQGRPMWT